jgi:lipopolysaccharide biosynthesis protein
MRTQIELARQYGIYGLCFYHHWSGGKHELEGSLRHFLADAGLDIKFCLCWETENWPTDNESEIRIPTSQDPSTDGVSLIEPLVAVFSDPRYVRIDGKPLLIVSRPSRLRDAAACAQQWRAYAKQLGLAGLYLVAAGARDAVDPRSLGFDALLEILPLLDLDDVTVEHSLTDPNYAGRIYSYPEIVDKWNNLADPPFVTFNTVIPGWDDEATRPGAGDSVAGSSPSLYAKWLMQSCQRTIRRRPEERLIFINAWNGWAQGAYLEPDRKFGYAYLHATANVLRCYHNDPEARKLIEDLNAGFSRRNDAAIVLHCHYEDLIVPIFDRYISQIKDADLFVTVRNDISKTAIEEIHRRFPNVFFLCQENRGRDIRPFLLALRQVESLGYTIACKVHTKKTPHREGDTGELWREELMGPLLGSAECVARAAQIFSQEADVGLLAPAGSVKHLRIHHVHAPNAFWLDRLLYRLGRSDLVGKYTFDFPAGSMYWFRVSALAGFENFILAEDEFEQELGQVDGTLGHSVERLVGLYAQGLGYRMKEVDSS